MSRTAVIFGATGVVGRALYEHLLELGDWNVVGVSRTRPGFIPHSMHVACDLEDADACRRALRAIEGPVDAFYTAWSRRSSEQEAIRVNSGMLDNAIEAFAGRGSLSHFALVTGVKHYLWQGPPGEGRDCDSPFVEDCPRLPCPNFYYDLEDTLLRRAMSGGFSWSVARPHTLIGSAVRTMNLGVTIAAYATLCRETHLPFQFPGSPEMLRHLTDMTDAALLAAHLVWEATDSRAANQTYNVVNGDVFRWHHMWSWIADYFGLAVAEYPGRAISLSGVMSDAAETWRAIALRYGLKHQRLDEVAQWWHLDADLSRQTECVVDMSRSRKLGFLQYRSTMECFRALFSRLERERVIPKY